MTNLKGQIDNRITRLTKGIRKTIIILTTLASIGISSPSLADQTKNLDQGKKESIREVEKGILSKQQINLNIKQYNKIIKKLEKIKKSPLNYINAPEKIAKEISDIRKEVYMLSASKSDKEWLINQINLLLIDLELFSVRYEMEEAYTLIFSGEYNKATKYIESIKQGIEQLGLWNLEEKTLKNLKAELQILKNTINERQKAEK